jgi:hypothetical protein
MDASCLSSIVPVILVEALGLVTHSSDKLLSFGILCKTLRQTLQDERFWRLLCKKFWRSTDDHLHHWPALSPIGLYKALEQWAPAEGYYVFTPAFPWGLLALVRLEQGLVQADVVRFVPRIQGGFDEVQVPLFKVALDEHDRGLTSRLEASWFNDAELAMIKPSELKAHTGKARLFPTLRIVTSRFFETDRALRISHGGKAFESNGFSNHLLDKSHRMQAAARGICLCESWDSGHFFYSREEAARRTAMMLKDMLAGGAIPCDLGLIRRPRDILACSESLPRIAPGLYVGDYGHKSYGQFRPEVLLVEYLTLSPEALRAELLSPNTSPLRLFARPLGGQPPPLEVILQLNTDVVILYGVKQCGDYHVPMGTTSFVAIVDPPEASAALATIDGALPPTVSLDRETFALEAVCQSWRGFGTLSPPGLQYPSWAGGWLVQLKGDSCREGHGRFRFLWDRNHQPIVLHWVGLQDTYPLLQRQWLPADLR